MRDPLDVTLVAAAAMGACLGFLWWNTSPARIFMGDTGSLALGGLLSGLAIVTRTELLLVVLGGLFVAVTLSVVIQVAFFRATRRRVFRMAPLHHHFELAGWTENTVIVRFWLVTGDGRRVRAGAVLRRLARRSPGCSMAQLTGRTVLVAGLGVSGAAAARVLLDRGAARAAHRRRRAAGRGRAGRGRRHLARRRAATVPDGVDLVVTSPGWRPDAPLLADAAAPRRRGHRRAGAGLAAARPGRRTAQPAPWLAVTGTNGKTTTVTMLEAILLAAGRRAVAAGNVGRPLVEVVTAVGTTTARPPTTRSPSSCRASSCTGRRTLAPAAAAVLNVADDHTDWHGSFAAYRDAKARILRGAPVAVADAGDPVAAAARRRATRTRSRSPSASRPRSARRPRRRAGRPRLRRRPGRGGAAGRWPTCRSPGRTTRSTPSPPRRWPAPSASPPRRSAAAWPASAAGRTATSSSATVGGVDYVDDSKATNPHAAGASLAGLPAGGLDRRRPAQGRRRRSAGRRGRRAAGRSGPAGPRPGRDRRSLARHAPTVPVVDGRQRRR